MRQSLKQPAEEARKIIDQSKVILVVPHQKPDGDALGSAGALAEALKKSGKKVFLFCESPVIGKKLELKSISNIESNPAFFSRSDLDTIIVVDSSSADYAGVDNHLGTRQKKVKVINIDHHKKNSQFGDINLVDEEASSTAEIIKEFIEFIGFKINRLAATSLLIGLIFDTKNFTNAATGKKALFYAYELLKKGADMPFAQNYLYGKESLNSLKLWGEAIEKIAYNQELELHYTSVTAKDFEKHQADKESAEGLSNFLLAMDNVRAFAFFREEDGKTKVSFRTKRDDVNVESWARHFGGGGHQKAAGYLSSSNLESTIETLFAWLKTTDHNSATT